MSKHRLELKAHNQIALTPQLQQAIRLLQMSSTELSSYIHDQLLSNPMLEETPDHNDQKKIDKNLLPEHDNAINDDYKPDIPDYALENHETDNNPTHHLDAQDAHPQDFCGDGFSSFSSPTAHPPPQNDQDPDINYIELLPNPPDNIRSFLMDQFKLLSNHHEEHFIALHLIDLIDDAGWFTENLNDVALQIRSKLDTVERVFFLLQSCEPAGIFARSLKECLTLQLQRLQCYDATFMTLIENLEDIASGNVKKLERKTRKPLHEVRKYVQSLRKLNPKPAALYTRSVADVVIPDIIVYKDSRNRWQTTLNEHILPRISVRRNFYKKVKRHISSPQEKTFVSENYQNASWLVKSISQRNRTMLKVAQHIVRHQQFFFDRGISAIKPMILKEIAERTELHESTISRITTNKFMATPWGTFELKYFFNVSLDSLNGTTCHATTSVKHAIKTMIDHEKSPHILSDEKLVQNLHEKGINIARRTVTKYREALNIPSSIVRRQQKNQPF